MFHCFFCRHRKLYFETHFLWAIRQGLNATLFMNVYFEKHWEMKMEDLRRMLNVETPPITPKKRDVYYVKNAAV